MSVGTIFQRGCRAILFRLLSNLQYGQLTIKDSGEAYVFGSSQDLKTTITINDYDVYRRILFGGSISAGESYIDGQWQSDNLTNLVRIMVLNMDLLDRFDQKYSLLTIPLRRLHHFLKDNSKTGSKKNILAHYDLSNKLYKSFLDPTMMYSSAIYPTPESTLDEASLHKVDLICRKLDLKPGDKVIEIGSGWGGFAIHAAAHYGCHVTTTTISEAQYQEALNRIKQSGLSEKITLLKNDYRDLSGQFDKLVSIEMIEAVGNRHLPEFLKKCCSLLKPDGIMLLQAITIADQKFDDYLKNVDFIQHHIFPGGFLPSNSRILSLLKENTDLVVRNIGDYGFHYARTLSDWKSKFLKAFPALEREGFDQKFRRLWEFYLCYCEGGFIERSISVVHITATRPMNRSSMEIL